MTTTARRYVIYLRVSTEDQGRSGLGLEAQRRDIDLFLSSFSEVPWEILGEFLEIQSGGDNDRPQLGKALEMVRKNPGAELLVAKLDRLSRRVAFIANIIEDKRVTLRVASMPHADTFQLHVYAALAEQERAFISARTKAALAAAKARGVKLGGNNDPAQKRNEARKATAVKEAMKLKDTVLALQAAGMSLRGIAERLNQMGLKTTRGADWSAVQVQRVIARVADR